jgi:hypothetical protein
MRGRSFCTRGTLTRCGITKFSPYVNQPFSRLSKICQLLLNLVLGLSGNEQASSSSWRSITLSWVGTRGINPDRYSGGFLGVSFES